MLAQKMKRQSESRKRVRETTTRFTYFRRTYIIHIIMLTVDTFSPYSDNTMLTQIHLYSCCGRTVILSLPSVSSETDRTVDTHIQLSRCCPSKKLGQFELKSDHQVSFRSIPFDGLDTIYIYIRRHISAFLTPQNLVPAMNLASRTPTLHSPRSQQHRK